MRIKILTAIYILVLAAIVFLVDRTATQPLFRFVYNIPYGDKIGHFCLMGIFSFLLNLALNAKAVKIEKNNFLLGTLIVLFVVVVEEFSQLWVRGRTFDWGDLLFDFVGIVLFGESARLLVKRRCLTASGEQG
ncbi:MAG: VanZ family protein [Acidobacteriota bacterium]|nr:VanZ family protein [Acidobacteriota bacterium]